jgi:hypothetical protein
MHTPPEGVGLQPRLHFLLLQAEEQLPPSSDLSSQSLKPSHTSPERMHVLLLRQRNQLPSATSQDSGLRCMWLHISPGNKLIQLLSSTSKSITAELPAKLKIK